MVRSKNDEYHVVKIENQLAGIDLGARGFA